MIKCIMKRKLEYAIGYALVNRMQQQLAVGDIPRELDHLSGTLSRCFRDGRCAPNARQADNSNLYRHRCELLLHPPSCGAFSARPCTLASLSLGAYCANKTLYFFLYNGVENVHRYTLRLYYLFSDYL